MNKKLLVLLRLFSKKETAQLYKFLHSPFFNENLAIQRLFQYVAQYFPNYDETKLSYENAGEFVFADNKNHKSALIKLNSKLFKLVEQFVVHRELTTNNFSQQLQLLKFYNNNFLNTHYESNLKNIKKQLCKVNLYDETRSYKIFQVANEHNEYLSKQDNRIGDTNLQAITTSFDIFYLENKLFQFCEMLNRQRTVNVKYDYTFFDEIVKYLQQENHLSNAIIAAYKKILQLLLNPSEKSYYFELKNHISENATDIPRERLASFYMYLSNSVKKLFSATAYHEELFDLYTKQLKHKIIYQEGFLLHSIFKNIVTVSVKLKKYDWCENFILQHKNKIIPKAYEDDVYCYNWANLYFHQKKYNKVTELLQESACKDIYYKLSQKQILAQTYYEIKEILLLESLLNSFGRLLHYYKSTISAHKLASYRSFVTFLNQLLRLIQENSRNWYQFEQNQSIDNSESLQDLVFLEKNVKKQAVFYGQKWLLAQIQSLHQPINA